MTRKTINTLACTLPKTEVSPAVNEVAEQHIQMKDYPVTKSAWPGTEARLREASHQNRYNVAMAAERLPCWPGKT